MFMNGTIQIPKKYFMLVKEVIIDIRVYLEGIKIFQTILKIIKYLLELLKKI